MPHVNIKGVGTAQFPDDMPINDIRAFLQKKFTQDAITGNSNVLAPAPTTAAPFTPTLTESIGQGVSDFLTDTGIISNRHGAQQIGKNIAAIGEFLPGIGDAAAGDEFGRAIAQGDAAGVALGALSAIPVVGKVAKGAIKKLQVNVTHNPRSGDIKITSENGKILGGIEGDSFVIGGATIKDPSKRGKGEGKGLYLAAIDEASARGLKLLVSDESVTPDAARVWESLKKDGFPVVKHKDARFINIRNDKGGFWGVDNDLPVYTMSIAKIKR